MLLGAAGRIDAVRPASNVAPDPSRHFELDPAVLIAAHRAARDAGPAVIGHYHSHPSGVAVPSATDAACAAPDGTLWLIVAGDVARLWIAPLGIRCNAVAFGMIDTRMTQGATTGEGGAVRFAEAMLDIR